MAFDAHRNLAYSTVATAPSPATSGTSLTLASGQGSRFPDPGTDGPFNCTIWPQNSFPLPTNAEIVRVTARTGDVLTITRAQEGTTARSVVPGDQIMLAITAKVVTDLEQELSVLSLAVSALSTAVSNEISVRAAGDAATSAQAASAASVIRTDLASLSLAVSVLTSAHNALSNAMSDALSAGGVLSLAVSALSTAVSNEQSVRSVGDAALSARITSVLSTDISNLRSATSTLSTNLSNELSVRAASVQTASAAATSADAHAATASAAATSDDARVTSVNAALSAVSARSAGVSTHGLQSVINALSTRIDAAGGGGSVTSTEVSAGDAATSAQAASAASVLRADLAALSLAVSALSTNVSTLSAKVVSVSAQLVSIDGRVGSVNTFLSGISARSAGVSTHGLQSVINALSTRIDAAGGGGSVTSTEVSAGDAATSAQAASALSAVYAALSARDDSAANATSVISQQVSLISVNLANLSQAVSVLSAAGNFLFLRNDDAVALSAGAPVYLGTSAASTFVRADADGTSALRQVIGLVADASVAAGGNARIQTAGRIVLTTAQWDSVTGQTGGLTLGAKYYLDVTAGRLTPTAPATGEWRVIGVAISTTAMQLQIAAVPDYFSTLSALSQTISAVDAALSARITSVLSTDVSNLRSADGVMSLAISALSTAISAGDAALSGRVTSVLSVDISNLRSATSTLSTVLSNEASVRAAADAALSTRIDGVGGPASAPTAKWVSVANVISSTTLVNVSGLSTSVSAGVLYELRAKLLINRGQTSAVSKIGLTFPPMKRVRGVVHLMTSALQGQAATVSAIGARAVFTGDSASGSIIVSAPPSGSSVTFLSTIAEIEGIFFVSTTGVIQIQAAFSSGAQQAGTIMEGSYMRVVRIN